MAQDRSPAAMRRKKEKAAAAPRGPRGASSTFIPNPDNPAANVSAQDVAVHHVAGGRLLAAGTTLATAAAVALRASLACSEVLIQADPDNAEDAFWGTSGADANQPMQLKPGDTASIPVKDAALVFVRSVGGTANINYVVSGL